jgi:hypothetical protein
MGCRRVEEIQENDAPLGGEFWLLVAPALGLDRIAASGDTGSRPPAGGLGR